MPILKTTFTSLKPVSIKFVERPLNTKVKELEPIFDKEKETEEILKAQKNRKSTLTK